MIRRVFPHCVDSKISRGFTQWVRVGLQQQLNSKRGSLPGRAGHVNPAAVRFDNDFMDNRQAETGPVRFRRQKRLE